ncbi:YfhO family protein [Lactovum miscens]|uniref:Putative membrane protein YfhO n=1 Tax=Lactovum miscens TaxID=190387 RepID=A0A841C7R4_9LACT|nr:YfhO family protein [Lactovum miscens]MBB5888525.1 putative membrane protein YfhO [Lactovum miscens]
MKSYFKSNKLYLFLAFVIPLVIAFLSLLANGIFWNSATSILAGDAYHQYVGLHSLYSQLLQSGKGFFYTWTSGLGLNLYAFASYYMGSFFMPLTFFFNVKNMPDALYLFTILKFGFIGLSAFVSFSNVYKSINKWLLLALSISYSLMSYMTSQIEITMWLDVFILLPLIFWGLHQIIDEKGRWIYYISLTILFIQNYYFGYIIAIFISLYFIVRMIAERLSIRKLIDFTVVSILSALTSLVMLWPMYLDLKANGQGFSNPDGYFTQNSWYFDLFSKNFIGSYDTTQFNAVPMIYVGLLPLILAITFFFIKSINWKLKVGMFLLGGLLIASFYFNWLDLAWQGFHSPNMFLHRYSFIFSFIVVIMALEALQKLKEIKFWKVFIATLILATGFIGSIISHHYSYIHFYMPVLTALFLFAFLILFYGLQKKYISMNIFAIIVLIFAIADIGINSYYEISGVSKEWVFASRTFYNDVTSRILPATQAIQKASGNKLERTDNVAPDTANDGMKFGYNGIAQFSSVRNSNSSAIMSALGFKTDGLYLNLRYPGNTLLMDSLFGVKYNINYWAQPPKFGFDPLLNAPSYVTQNPYSQSIGMFVPGGYHDINIVQNNPLTNQTNFLNALTNSNTKLYTKIHSSSEKAEGQVVNTNGHVSFTKLKNSSTDLSITYSLTVPANSQSYIQIPNITYASKNDKSIVISVGNHLSTMPTEDTGEYFNLGYFEKESTQQITITFPKNDWVSFDQINFWAMDINAYTQAMAKIKDNPVSVKTIKNGAAINYSASQNGQLFLTVPYDKGWSAILDGKKVKLYKAQSGFMKIDAPAGKHQIKISFFPEGLKEGSIAFVLGIISFLFYNRLRKLKNRKSSSLD